MQREFLEETGVNTLPDDWDCFATMKFEDDIMGGSAVVHCLRNFTNQVFDCRTVEIERICVFRLVDNVPLSFPPLQGQKIISNLDVLIPMAKDRNFIFANLEMK